MEFLRRQGAHADAPRPDLVLLDLNLPRKDGREVLAEARGDEGLRSLPILVLTSSSAHLDIKSAYDRHANAYLTKPTDFARFCTSMRTVVAWTITRKMRRLIARKEATVSRLTSIALLLVLAGCEGPVDEGAKPGGDDGTTDSAAGRSTPG